MKFCYASQSISLQDETGAVKARIDFPIAEDGTVTITHTYVDESLRGQNIAAQLMAAAVETLRQRGLKARITCSYAQKWLQRHPESGIDILA